MGSTPPLSAKFKGEYLHNGVQHSVVNAYSKHNLTGSTPVFPTKSLEDTGSIPVVVAQW